MSTAIAKNFQVGSDGTATNNFTIRQPATPDGTVRIANGNSGTTTDLVTVTSAGNVGVGTTSPTAKLDVSGTAAVSGSFAVAGNNISAVNSMGFRNRIINGAMMVNQRATSITDGGYSVDRWEYSSSASAKFTVAQSSTATTGFINSLLATSSSSYSVTSGDYFMLNQKVEGLNVADLGWGAANASAVTLSFWVRSSLTGTFGGSLRNSAGDRSYPFTYTISAVNTWEQKVITVAGDTSGTWLTTNGIGIRVAFGLGVGSTYSGTAGSWAAANYISATGATSVVGTNGATFYITGVQLEAGSVATPFERRDYGRELIMCQRYYQQLMGNSAELYAWTMWSLNTASASSYIFFPVVMRASPTCTVVGTPQNVSGGSVAADKWSIYSSVWKGCNLISLNTQSRTGVRFDAYPVDAITAGGACGLYGGNQCNLTFSAEL